MLRSDTRAHAARRSLIQNKDVFFYTNIIGSQEDEDGKEKDLLLYLKDLGNNRFVGIKRPSSPYAEFGLMVFAFQEPLEEGEDGRIPTKFIYDYDEEMQQEYFKSILAVMDVAEEMHVSGKKHDQYTHVMMMANDTSRVSDEEFRIGRSLWFPHAQAGDMNPHLLDTSDPLPVLRRQQIEQKIVFDATTRYADEVEKSLQEKTEQDLSISLRRAAPIGYDIHTKISKHVPLTKRAEQLRSVMQANHTVYQEIAQEYYEEHKTQRAEAKVSSAQDLTKLNPRPLDKTIIPQPSYHTFMYFDENDNLAIAISPAVLATTAVLEKAGVKRDTSPDYPVRYTPKQRSAIEKKQEERLQEALAA